MNLKEFRALGKLQKEYFFSVDDHISDCLCDNCIIMKTLTYIYHDNRWKCLK